MASNWGVWFKERDLLVGSNDVANGQEFHAGGKIISPLLGPLEKIFSGYWKLSRFLPSIENVISI
jgi:hypothetical protein